MLLRLILTLLLAYAPAAFADDPRHPNGSLYYIVLDNFQDEVVEELDTLAVNKFKNEIENRGYRLVFINGGDISSIKKAAFDPNTSVIVISGHGDDSGKVTSRFFEGIRIRSIFGSSSTSKRLEKVVIGTCYSSCVAEKWNLRNGKVVPMTFGNFAIGIEWFQNYLTSPAFLAQLKKRSPGAGAKTIAGTTFQNFRKTVQSAKSVNEIRDAIGTYKKQPDYDLKFDAARIREAVYHALLENPKISVNAKDFETASHLGLTNATMSDLFLRFSRSGPTPAEAKAALRTMDRLAKNMSIENGVSAMTGAENLAKVIAKNENGARALSVLKQIKDDELRGAFGFQLLKEAKTPREYLNVMKRLPDSYAGGSLAILLDLKPTTDEILESLRHVPSSAIARNNLSLTLGRTKDPDASIALFRGYRSFAESKSDLAFFDNNLTSFFRTQPGPQHYKSAELLCETKLCRESVARNFVAQATTLEDLQLIAKEIRSGKVFLDQRVEMTIRSRAAALHAEVPASHLQTEATRAFALCKGLFGKLARGH